MLNKTQQKKILKIGRETILSVLKKKELDQQIISLIKEFPDKSGVFVTLKKKGELRGCIGYVEDYMPLGEAVMNAARAAAFQDNRFESVTMDEMKDIILEISVLTPKKRISAKTASDIIKQIKIGEDGLIIDAGYTSGLLLPQVATENDFIAEEFLEHTCIKSGLPKNAWLDPKINIYRFQAQIFCEDDTK